MACRIDTPTAGSASLLNSGGSSRMAAITCPGMAKAASQAEITPSDDRPLTITGRPITRSMKRTRSVPNRSRLYRPGVHVDRPWPRRSTA